MSTLRIDNKSEDDIIIISDGTEHELRDGESLSLDTIEKGRHSVLFHRKRIPRETALEIDKPRGLDVLKNQDDKPGSHIQLDTEIVFDVNSSKTALTVYKKASAVETLHEDVIFVSYKADISGAKVISSKDSFANSIIKRAYLFQQIKSAFFPVGIIGIIVMLMGITASVMALSGIKFKIGSSVVSNGYIFMILAVGIALIVYFIVNLIKILKRAKKLSR